MCYICWYLMFICVGYKNESGQSCLCNVTLATHFVKDHDLISTTNLTGILERKLGYGPTFNMFYYKFCLESGVYSIGS